MRVKGLPIGHGELWHDSTQRVVTLAIVVLALAPLLGWLLPACGWMAPGRYQTWIEPPLVGVLIAIAVFASSRWQAIATRVGIGLVVGLVGSLAYDLALYLSRFAVAGLNFPLPPLGLPAGLAAGGEPWPVHLHHWLAAAAAWGLGYAVLTGKARWYYGLAWSACLWLAVVAMAMILPHGNVVLPTITAGILGTLFVVHLLFGAVIGALNEVMQPATRGQGKIIFLRDYVARVKQH